MPDLRLKLVFVAIMVGVFSGSLVGCGNGDGDNTGSISGTVYSDEMTPNEPLQEALLTAVEGTTEIAAALSGSNGGYAIIGLPAGTYFVKASKTGYAESPPAEVGVVSGSNTGGVDFTLKKQ